MSDLGSVVVGQAAATPASFIIRNTGGQPSGTPTVTVTGEGFAVGTSNCGPSAINGGAMCTVTVAFRPTTPGPKSGMLSVSASPGGTVSAALSGVGAAPGALTTSTNKVDFPGTLVNGMSGGEIVTITNTGGSPIANLAVAVGDTMNFTLATTCMPTLAGGASCTATVVFAPKSRGPKTSALSVTGGTQSLTVALAGTGQTAPTLVVQPATFAFAGIVNQTSPVQRFIVGNTGDVASGAPTVALAGANMGEFTIVSNECVTPLAALATCNVEVAFKPTSMGTKAASLNVSGTPGGMASSALTGTAVVGGNISIAPASADLGTVTVGTASAATTLTVTNNGGSATGAIAVSLASSEFAKGADTCTGVVLAPMGTCTIAVSITATSAGAKSAVIVVSGGAAGQAVASLSAVAASGPAFSISPASLAFGNANTGTTSAAQMFTITNTGAAATGVPSVSLTGMSPNEFMVSGNSCNAALAPLGTCAVSIVFKPSLVQASTASLNVMGSPGGTATGTLSGTGTLVGQLGVFPSANPTGGLQDFGSIVVGQMSDPPVSFTVRNNGSVASGTVTVALAGMNSTSFAIVSNGCMDANLAPGATCVVTVRFTPMSQATVLTGTLTATAMGGTGSVVLNGRGLAGVEIFPNASADVSPYDHLTASVGVNVGGNNKRHFVYVRGALGTITAAVTAGSSDFAILDGVVSVTCHNRSGYTSSGVNLPIYTNGLHDIGMSAEVCSFDTAFTPSARGARTGEVTITAGTSSAKVALKGTGVGPLVITPSTYAFTNTAVGAQQSQTFTIVNNAAGAVTLGTIVLSGDTADFAITSNNCGANLNGGANGTGCTVIVSFQPTTAAAKTATLTATGTIAATAETIAATISGTGTAAPGITLAPVSGSSTTFPTTAIGNISSTQTFVVTNTGTSATSDIDLAIFQSGFGGTGNYALTDGCTAALAPGATCQATITFSPLPGKTGTRTGLLRAVGQPGGTASLNLTGTATAGIVVTADADGGAVLSSLDFGYIPVSTASAGQYFRVYNKDDATLGAALTFAYENAGDWPQNAATNFVVFDNQCTAALTAVGTGAGEYCRYGVRAASNASAGVHTGRLKITGATSNTIAIVDLRVVVGAGAGQAGITLTNNPTTQSLGSVFAAQAGAEAVTFNFVNSGGAAGAITVTWDNLAPLPAALELVTPSGTACATGINLAAGGSCNLAVRLNNAAVATTVSNVLKVCVTGTTYCDSVTVTGRIDTAAAQAGLITQGNVLFSNRSVGIFATVDHDSGATQSSDVTFTLTNRSDASITTQNAAGWATFTTGTHFSRTGGTCAQNTAVASGASCTLIVTFNPTSAGIKRDVLTINSLVPDDILTIPLVGIGSDDVVLAITSPLTERNDFGDVTIGATRPLTFVVTNNGTATSQQVTLSVVGPDYTVSGCGAALAAGGTCSALVTFAPTVATGVGTIADTLTASAGAFSGTQALTGRAVNAADLVLTAGSTLTYTNQYTYANDPTAASTVTVRNGAGADTLVNRARAGVLSISAVDGVNYYINGSTCAEEETLGLDPGATCNYTINYLPQVQDVNNNSTATVTATPGGSENSSLIGNSVGAVQWENGARVTSHSFGNVTRNTAGTPVTLAVRNKATAGSGYTTGNLSLNLASASGQFAITADACTGSNLAVNGTCNVTVNVTPAAAGAVAGSITVNGAPGFSAKIDLTATGL